VKSLFIATILMLLTCPLSAAENPASKQLAQGRAQLKSGNYKAAVKSFEAATKADPASAEAFEGLGDAYLGMGDNPVATDPELVGKAVASLKTASKLNPGSAPVRYKLAIGYLALFDKEGAEREFGLLKGMDKGLADELAKRLRSYKAPENYRQTGTTETRRAGAARTVEGRFTGTVELFVVSWCPHCKKAIAYMQQKGIPHRAYDVEADPAAKKRFNELGGRGYPLILIGAKKMYGWDAKTFDYYLGR